MLIPSDRLRGPMVDEPAVYTGALEYAVVEVTNRCNQRCLHCASNSGKARDDELGLAEWRGVMADIAALGGKEVTLIGGELLLRPDWPALCDAVNERGLALAVITNGLLLRGGGRNLAELARVAPAVVGVSLDGATPASYRARRRVDAFDSVWETVLRVRDAGPWQTSVITSFSRSNLGDVQRFAELLAGQGLVWQVQIVHKAGQRFEDEDFLGPDEYLALVRELADVRLREGTRLPMVTMDDHGYHALDERLRGATAFAGCHGGRSVIGIRANGDVLACLSLGDAFVEDNLRRRPLAEIWRDGGSFGRFRRKRRLLSGHCDECAMADTCLAGCTAMAVSGSGGVGENPYCVRHLETLELVADALGTADVVGTADVLGTAPAASSAGGLGVRLG